MHSYSGEVSPRPWKIGGVRVGDRVARREAALGVVTIINARGDWVASVISRGTADAIVAAVNAEHEAKLQAVGVPDMTPPA